VGRDDEVTERRLGIVYVESERRSLDAGGGRC
jgi:hypothetical protein